MTDNRTANEKKADALAKARAVKAANKAGAQNAINGEDGRDDPGPDDPLEEGQTVTPPADIEPEPPADAVAPADPTTMRPPEDRAPVRKSEKAKLVEVELLKKYAPFKIVNEKGDLVPQGEVKQTLAPGLAYLEPDEAERVLSNKQAMPTANTYRQLRGEK